jgi:UDP-N-acetylglucosamine 4,6-dehydratase
MTKDYLKNQTILVTGGTGSFGQAFTNYILNDYKKIRKLIIFSRDESKQYDMEKNFNKKNYPQVRFILGDIRDKDRLKYLMSDVDTVIHAAALKHVHKGEKDPLEFIKTNVYGSQNIIESALDNSVRKVIALSTDKACAPENLYGSTKLCSEKLFISANNIKGKKDISFSVVRYGNVFGSRGSVLQAFLKQMKNEFLTVTDKRMTRFHISIKSAVNSVIWAIKNLKGGEVLVPKLKSYNIMDLCTALSPNIKIKFIGIQPGEKLHEDLITNYEAINTTELSKYYIILKNKNLDKRQFYNPKNVKKEFYYNSINNNDFLSVNELKELIREYIFKQ